MRTTRRTLAPVAIRGATVPVDDDTSPVRESRFDIHAGGNDDPKVKYSTAIAFELPDDLRRPGQLRSASLVFTGAACPRGAVSTKFGTIEGAPQDIREVDMAGGGGRNNGELVIEGGEGRPGAWTKDEGTWGALATLAVFEAVDAGRRTIIFRWDADTFDPGSGAAYLVADGVYLELSYDAAIDALEHGTITAGSFGWPAATPSMAFGIDVTVRGNVGPVSPVPEPLWDGTIGRQAYPLPRVAVAYNISWGSTKHLDAGTDAAAAAGVPCVLDWESQDAFERCDPIRSPRTIVDQAIGRAHEMIDHCRRRHPGLDIGYFGLLPAVTTHYNRIAHRFYGYREAMATLNGRTLNLVRAVDRLYPTLYLPQGWREDWGRFRSKAFDVVDKIKVIADDYGKECRPFIRPAHFGDVRHWREYRDHVVDVFGGAVIWELDGFDDFDIYA